MALPWAARWANLLKAAGYDVTREYYINDAGNQINNLAASVNARYLEELGVDVEFPENGYHGHDIVETAQRIVKIYGDKFLHMDEQERLHEFRTIALKEKLAALKEDLEAFNVTFDVWFSEQTLHDADKIKEACDLLTERGYMYEQDGALWLKATAYGDDKDRVVTEKTVCPLTWRPISLTTGTNSAAVLTVSLICGAPTIMVILPE